MQLKPHHIGIVVADLERSTHFYRVLGFEVVQDMPAEDGSRAIRFIRLGEFEIELFWYAETPAEAPVPAGKGQAGYRHFALRTTNIDGVLAELQARGFVSADAQIRRVPAGYSLLFLTDPDGLEIEVMQEDAPSVPA